MANWQSRYLPPTAALWQGRRDSLSNERFFQCIQCHDLRADFPALLDEKTLGIIGFASDEGIKRNLGRVGSSEAPHAIRQVLAKLAMPRQDIMLYDFGDIVCTDGDLEASQAALADLVQELIKEDIKPIVLGGGHETAYGHYLGLKAANSNQHVGIINFDAHFDLRPLNAEGLSTSGSPFFQIAKNCQKNNYNFDYFCIGIQKTSNTRSLFQTAEELAVNYIFAEDIHTLPIDNFFADIDDFIQNQTNLYLSLCMDVFASAFAPGVSAPAALGLWPTQVLSLFKRIVKSGKVLSFDIVELSPPFDQDHMTAALAANFVFEYILNLP